MKFKLFFIFALIFSSLPLCVMGHPSVDDELADAVKTGNIKEVESCLIRGANPDIKTDEWSICSALIYAAEKGNFHIVRFLLDYHANINAVNEKGKTALMYAAKNGHTNIVKLLLNHQADLSVFDVKGQTTLIFAAKKGHAQIVKLLLKNGIRAHEINLALLFAIRFNQPMIVSILLKNNANINVVKENVYALKYGSVKTIELLLKHINHILDKADDSKTCNTWDLFILSALDYCTNPPGSSYVPGWTFDIKKINIFRILLHHADKLPLYRKKLESLTAQTLGTRCGGEYAFRKTVEHLRKEAF